LALSDAALKSSLAGVSADAVAVRNRNVRRDMGNSNFMTTKTVEKLRGGQGKMFRNYH
jgi:hypothetical protein